jgi:TolB-like protein
MEQDVQDVLKKKDKVRSAWISFAGRITAQIIGAVATVTLGVLVLGKPTTLSGATKAKHVSEDTVATVSATVRTPEETVVAVLPMDDYSNHPDHFSEAMTEAVIADLSQLGRLRVISRTSAEHFKRSQLPLTQASRELGASHVIEGSVTRSNGRVRVTAQLIDARTDEHIWAHSYDRKVSNELAVQEEVAAIIADEVGAALLQDSWKAGASAPADSQVSSGKRPLVRALGN